MRKSFMHHLIAAVGVGSVFLAFTTAGAINIYAVSKPGAWERCVNDPVWGLYTEFSDYEVELKKSVIAERCGVRR